MHYGIGVGPFYVGSSTKRHKRRPQTKRERKITWTLFWPVMASILCSQIHPTWLAWTIGIVVALPVVLLIWAVLWDDSPAKPHTATPVSDPTTRKFEAN